MYYPIKSLRGNPLEEALICSYGLEHDRRWMLVDPQSRMITQRECTLLATLSALAGKDSLRVAAPGGREISVAYDAGTWTSDEVVVDVWGHAYVGVAAVSPINQAISEMIGMDCRLLSIRADVFRVKRDVAFHDDSPILIISESSLEELNRRLTVAVADEPLPSQHRGCDAAPFDEDGWQRIAIGELPPPRTRRL